MTPIRRPTRAARRKTREADAKTKATTRASPTLKFRARCSKAARTYVRPIIAGVTGRQRVMRNRSTPRQVTSDIGGVGQNREEIMSADENDHKRDLSRRNILLAGTTLTAASVLGSAPPVQAHNRNKPHVGQTAEHPRHHGRRRRLVQHRRVPPGDHVRQDAESRQARRRGNDVHRLLRGGELHGGPRELHHRANPVAHRPDHGRPGRRRCRHAGPGCDDCATSSSRWATRPDNSARTISAT